MNSKLFPASSMSLKRVGGLLALVAAALTVACVSVGDATTAVPRTQGSQPTFDRINCEEIAGTAFRSDAERKWYNDNCGKWPLVNVPNSPAGASVAQRSLPPECAAMRGKPYTSNEQRDWYLATAQGNPTDTQVQTGAGDRTNCDEIRGTNYRSSAEREWYIKNCPANGPVTTTTTSGADRTSCDEIRGTAYRSNSERDWYIKNCSGTTTNGGTTQQQITINRPTTSNNNGNGNGNGAGATKPNQGADIHGNRD